MGIIPNIKSNDKQHIIYIKMTYMINQLVPGHRRSR